MSSITYEVTASALNIRIEPNTNCTVLGSMLRGTQVVSDSQANGWAHINYNGIEGYASMTYLKFVSEEKEEEPNAVVGSTIQPAITGSIDQTADMTISQYAKYITSNSTDADKEQFNRYVRSFGCPPQFNKWVDLQYNDDIGPGQGRRISESFFVNPAILSLCPGTVSYLPGFSSKEKDQFLNTIKANIAGVDLKNTGDGLSGKLYEFKSAYTSYINTVNMLCRATAVYLGIGDEKMPNSSIALKNFDYGYWTVPEQSSQNGTSIFAETKKALSSIVSDNNYIHFFVAHQGTSYSESMNTSIAASELESTFNNSGLHNTSRNLEFLFGGALNGSMLEKDINRALEDASSTSDFIGQFGKLAKNYLSGGRLVFPQMIDSVGFDKAVSCTLKFVSLYGDKLSIFLRCYVPVLHLLAFALPKQLSENMYTYPYLLRAFQKGNCNLDLAVMTGLRLSKGGQDNTCWTIDGLPTEIEATFDITPLYSNLMSSDTTQPFMFLQNTSLAEYLATMCGVDMKANNLWAKVDLAKIALQGKITGIPTNLGRSIIDTKLTNGLRKFAQIIN